MEFGGSLPSKAKLSNNVPLTYAHFASLESGEVLEAATKDLVKIFDLKVSDQWAVVIGASLGAWLCC